MAIAGKRVSTNLYEFPYMKPQNVNKWQSFKQSLWNPDTAELFGRTFKSWGLLLLFYVIFYTVLAALFAICMQIFYWTLDEKQPKWKLDESLIGTNPGLGFRPMSQSVEEGSLIWYEAKKEESVQKWVNESNNFLKEYSSSIESSESINRIHCDYKTVLKDEQVCAVPVDDFKDCSPSNGFGFNKSSPCIFLKLNRIYGWVPDVYNDPENLPQEMPNDLKEHIRQSHESERDNIWVSCQGENTFDKELVGHNIKYFPTRGFPAYFYPFTNNAGYLSPLVAVQVVRPKPHVLINIECRAWAKNINYHGGNQREGSVHFEVLVD